MLGVLWTEKIAESILSKHLSTVPTYFDSCFVYIHIQGLPQLILNIHVIQT